MPLGAVLGGVLSAGASLLGGLFGKDDAEDQRRKEEKAIRTANEQNAIAANRMNAEVRARADAAALVPVQTMRETAGGVDMDAFIAAAEEYGFNPLTFLRSGALSLFAKTYDFTCTTGERAMDAALSGQYTPQMQPVIGSTPVPSTGEILGNSFQNGLNTYMNISQANDQNELQRRALEAQLQGFNRSGGTGQPMSFYAPSAKYVGGLGKDKADTVKEGYWKDPATGKVYPTVWTEYYDQLTGRIVWGPSSQGPDSEQGTMAGAMSGAGYLFGVDPKPVKTSKPAEAWSSYVHGTSPTIDMMLSGMGKFQ